MKRIGIFGDTWSACTGFSVVLTNLARQLATHNDLDVYYFGRYGCDEGYEEPRLVHNFTGIPTQGGVWDKDFVVKLINKFNVDLVFTEDDWFSIGGIMGATKFCGKPLFWLSPVDSLPVKVIGLSVMRKANCLFVPSRGAQLYLASNNIESTYLPHGVTRHFRPFKMNNKPDKFTFVWVGRDSDRKCLGRAIMAFERLINSGREACLVVRSDWTTPYGFRTLRYIEHKGLTSIIREQMEDNPHGELSKTYNRGDCFICSSKAGGFEMGTIEAGACGLPVLVTNHTFMNEQVVDGKNGFLIKVDKYVKSHYGTIWANISVDDLTNKMLFYVNNPNIAKIHGRYNMAYVNNKYNWTNAGATLYDKIKTI